MAKLLKMLNKYLGLKGFTLVEVLVTMSIVAVLLIFSVINIPPQIIKAQDAVRKAHLDSMKKAIDTYYEATSCYPQTIPSCKNAIILNGVIIKDDLPCDPKLNLSYTYVPEIADCPKWFQLYANLGNDDDKIIDRVGCRNGCGPSCQFNYGVASTNQNLNPYCSEFVSIPVPGPLSTPVPTPEISPSPVPEAPLQYVCAPGNNNCEVFSDPQISGCPDVYLNDPLCQDACTDKRNRCHDSRGK